MPANVVKTAEDERLWNKAKVQAEKQGRAGDYAYIMGIFKKMTGRKSEEPAGCATPGEKKRSEGMGAGEARGGGKGPMGKPVGLKKAFTIPAGFKMQRIPGQVPAKSLERAAKLDKMPKGSRAAQLLNHTDPMLSPNAVVKGLGFDMTKEGDWTKFLEEAFQTSPNELVLRKTIMEKALLEKQEPALRRAILERSLSYWRESRKSMVEVLTPDELLEKGTPFGGKTPKGYTKKKGKGGKPIYVKEGTGKKSGKKKSKKSKAAPELTPEQKAEEAFKVKCLLQTKYADHAYAKEAADAVAKKLVKHVNQMYGYILHEKQLSSHPAFERQRMEKTLTPLVAEYYKNAVDDVKAGHSWGNVDWSDTDEFIRQVVRPGLSKVFNSVTKFQGVGPLSYVNRLRKMEKIPWEREMRNWDSEANAEYHEVRKREKAAQSGMGKLDYGELMKLPVGAKVTVEVSPGDIGVGVKTKKGGSTIWKFTRSDGVTLDIGDEQFLDSAVRGVGKVEKAMPTEERFVMRKAVARGGKYYKRVPKKDGNGHHYFYKPEDYDNRPDAHLSGEDAGRTYLSGKVAKCVAAAGKKGCGPDAFQDLVKKHGHKSVAQVLKDSVNGGKLSFKKGKFYAVESKRSEA